jgi:hypothetical protein
MVFEVLSTQCGTPGGIMLKNNETDARVARRHLQHVTFLKVYRLETEMVDVPPIVDMIGAPIGPQGVD